MSADAIRIGRRLLAGLARIEAMPERLRGDGRAMTPVLAKQTATADEARALGLTPAACINAAQAADKGKG